MISAMAFWSRVKVLTSGNVTAVVLSSIGGQGTPTTTNVQQPVRRLEVELFTNEGELVVLQLLEGFEFGRIRDDSRSVNPEGNGSRLDSEVSVVDRTDGAPVRLLSHSHAWAQEPLVKVITTVVVFPDLILILTFRMEDDIGNELGEDESEVVHGQGESRPIVSVFHLLEDVA